MKANEQTTFDSNNPNDRRAMRNKARSSYQKLANLIWPQSTSSQQTAYVQEVGRRLDQLEIFAKYVDKLNREIAKKLCAFHKVEPQALELPSALFLGRQEEQIAFIEAYYLLAWRLLEAAKHVKGFEKMDKKAKGVVKVRNRLIQHPECDGVFEWSYAIVGTTGDIKLKPMPMIAGQPRFLDRGFANNDLELHASIFDAASLSIEIIGDSAIGGRRVVFFFVQGK